MAQIADSDIQTRYTVVTGSAGNTTPSSAPQSLGWYMSTTQWSGQSVNDLFDNITGAENAAGVSDFRCIAVYNTNSLNAWQNVVVFISSDAPGGATIAVGVDPTPPGPANSSSAQALQIPNETTPPTGVTFSSPNTSNTGLLMGTIAPGQCKCVWVRRTATNSAALAVDSCTLSFQGESGGL